MTDDLFYGEAGGCRYACVSTMIATISPAAGASRPAPRLKWSDRPKRVALAPVATLSIVLKPFRLAHIGRAAVAIAPIQPILPLRNGHLRYHAAGT